MNYKMKLLGLAVAASLLSACGANQENSELPTLAEGDNASDKSYYLVANAFDFTDEVALPGESYVKRQLIRGLADGVEATVTFSGEGEFAVDKAVSALKPDTTYEQDLTKLAFMSAGEEATITNGTWIVYRGMASDDFDGQLQVTFTVKDGHYPGEAVSSESVSDSFTITTLPEGTDALPFAFTDLVRDADEALDTSVAPEAEVTSEVIEVTSEVDGLSTGSVNLSIEGGVATITRYTNNPYQQNSLESVVVDGTASIASALVYPRDTVVVTAVAASDYEDSSMVELMIGTQSAQWTIETMMKPVEAP